MVADTLAALAILASVVLISAWFFTPYPARGVGFVIGWAIGQVTRRGRGRRA